MQTRTYSNCAAHNPNNTLDEPQCWNLVSGQIDCCDQHQTHQEDSDQTAFINENRQSIMGGISEMTITQKLLQKLRKM